jgi:hypothetical protein
MKWQDYWPNTCHSQVWEVRADQQGFSLFFDTRKQARCYKKLLLDSRRHIESKIWLRESWGLFEFAPREVR